MDLYTLLGVARGASAAEIERAYRRLARRYHPGVNPGDRVAAERYRELQHAYSVLADADRRREYDEGAPVALESVVTTVAFDGFDFSRAADGPHWFWLHAYFDVQQSRERVVVSYRRSPAVPLARVQRESLLDRFPLRGGGVHKPAWQATVRTIVRNGAGAVVFVDESTAVDERAPSLLARHVGSQGRPLLDAPRSAPTVDVGAALARLGVATEPAAFLSEP